jgi:hypothetical protein
MMYIFDANNLAGKLGLLGEVDFDKMLLARLRGYFGDRRPEVCLIFDSVDPVGDRFSSGNIEVVYTPRDNYYSSADDKVLEVALAHLADEDFKDELVIVTDDLDLTEKVRAAIAYHAKRDKVRVVRSTDFADKIKAREEAVFAEGLTDKSEAEEAGESLKAELLEIWGEAKE